MDVYPLGQEACAAQAPGQARLLAGACVGTSSAGQLRREVNAYGNQTCVGPWQLLPLPQGVLPARSELRGTEARGCDSCQSASGSCGHAEPSSPAHVPYAPPGSTPATVAASLWGSFQRAGHQAPSWLCPQRAGEMAQRMETARLCSPAPPARVYWALGKSEEGHRPPSTRGFGHTPGRSELSNVAPSLTTLIHQALSASLSRRGNRGMHLETKQLGLGLRHGAGNFIQ